MLYKFDFSRFLSRSTPIKIKLVKPSDRCMSPERLFELGHVVATPKALRLMLRNGVQPHNLLERHVHGDWSEMTGEDQLSNLYAVANGTRIFSAFKIADTDHKVYCITEADRSVTTFLCPDEY